MFRLKLTALNREFLYPLLQAYGGTSQDVGSKDSSPMSWSGPKLTGWSAAISTESLR